MVQRLVRSVLVAALLSCALPALAGAAPTWLPPIDLQPLTTDHGPIYGDSTTTTRPDGTIVVVTGQGESVPSRIEARVRPAEGTFGPAQTLEPALHGAMTAPPVVTVDATGTVAAVWKDYNALRVAIMEPGATTFGPTETLASDLSSGQPVVAVASGVVTVVWTANFQVEAATRPPGGAFGAPVTLSGAGQSATMPAVASGADGTTVVVWERFDGAHPVFQAAARPPGGAFEALPDLFTSAGDTTSLYGESVAVAPDGRATVLFLDFDGTRNTLWAMSRGTSGAFGGLDAVSEPSVDQGGGGFDLALDDQDTALAVWSQSGVLAATTRPSGGTFSDAIQPVAQGSYGTPSAAFTPGGLGIVMWNGERGAAHGVLAATRPRGGSFGAPADVDVVDAESYAGGTLAIGVDDQGNATTLVSAGQDVDPGPSQDFRFTYRTVTLDAAGPAISGLSVPPAASVGNAVLMSAAAHDRWSEPSSLTWSFGDGATGGGGTFMHAYARPGTYTVTATATDAVGNTSAATATIRVTGPASEGPKGTPAASLAARRISGAWKAGRATTTLRSLTVTGAVKGATVTVRCSGGTRKGCRFSRRAVEVAKAGTVSLTKLFNTTRKHGKRKVKVVSHLKAGAVVTVTVTAPGHRGRRYVAAIRAKGKAPSTKAACLAAGSATRTTGC